MRYGDEFAKRDFKIVLELAIKMLDRVDEKKIEGDLSAWVLREFLFYGRE